MPHPDDALAIQWLAEKYGPLLFHASLIPYVGIRVEFTDFVCVYAEEPKNRWIEARQERKLSPGGAVRLPNINKRKAAQIIRDFTPSEEWEDWIRLHQRSIRREFRWAKTEEALLSIARRETIQYKVPMAMIGFGVTATDEPVAILYCHAALRIDRALALLGEAWEYLA